jgi:hypothetical protein
MGSSGQVVLYPQAARAQKESTEMSEDDYYHTVEEGAPMVYHDHADCSEGLKIEPQHYRKGKGVGRRLCEVCEAKG